MPKEELGQELRDAGLKITSPRVKILKIFEDSTEHHLSAEDVYQKLIQAGEDFGLATVYRVLSQFEATSLITKHNFSGEKDFAVYELNQGEHHDHLVCVKCGRIEEFCNPIIEAEQEKIAKKYGYKMTHYALNIYGFCGKC